METYFNLDYASSRDALLQHAGTEIRQNPKPETVRLWARIVARAVYGGAIDFFKGWDACWKAAVGAGVPQLEAQELIGIAFATAKQDVVEA